MLTGRQLTIDDYFKILRQRLWFLLIPVILGPVVAFLIARRLSPKYTSNSLILIQEPKVPTNFVPSVLNNNLLSRLASMREQILSRTQLQPVIESYGLYQKDIKKVSMEELVERMRAAISIKLAHFSNGETGGSSARDEVPGFQISFTADTPQAAQSVCTKITSMFIDANLRLQATRAQGTANFIEYQLQKAKRQLDEQDARLAQFKRQYFGSLPDQEQSTIRIIETLSNQLNALTETMTGYQEQRTFTESMLNQQLQAWKSAQQVGGGNPRTLQQQLGNLENNLTGLRARYTDSYPDVIKTEQDIAAIKAKIAQQNLAANNHKAKATLRKMTSAAAEPQQIHQLRAELREMTVAMRDNRAQQSMLRKQIASYESKLKMTPAVEEQFKDLTRNYKTAQAFYDSLLAKEDESQMSTSLEERQEGQNFQVLDPADLPRKPSFPNYWRFAGGGLLVGAMLGFGVVLGIEMRDKSLKDERDIEFFIGVPTLALIPALESGQKRAFWAVWRGKTKQIAAKPAGG